VFSDDIPIGPWWAPVAGCFRSSPWHVWATPVFPPPPFWPGCGLPFSHWLLCSHLVLTLFPTGQPRFCLVQLVPISQTNTSRTVYSLPWWWRQQVPLEYWKTSTRLHGTSTQKTVTIILAAMRTWNLTYIANVLLLIRWVVTCVSCL
jgi:hypothetical protein